jgi:hypothetical protein
MPLRALEPLSHGLSQVSQIACGRSALTGPCTAGAPVQMTGPTYISTAQLNVTWLGP